jgi:ABC-type antimicrobial peptide transport system permease subunit
VENTYLTTFQALGGLGLLLGTLGLAAVLLRNVLERRKELGLLRAVGYTPAQLSRLVLAENLYLLAAGLLVGAACAALAIAPAFLSRGGQAPNGSLALLLAIPVVGLLASVWAVRSVVRAPLVSALKSD